MATAGPVSRHGDATPGEENADASGGADLVSAHAHEVQAEFREGHVQSGDRLGGIRMDEASAGVHERSEVCDRLNRANLGGHEGHGPEREASVPRVGEVVTGPRGQHRAAARIHGQNLPGEALA